MRPFIRGADHGALTNPAGPRRQLPQGSTLNPNPLLVLQGQLQGLGHSESQQVGTRITILCLKGIKILMFPLSEVY